MLECRIDITQPISRRGLQDLKDATAAVLAGTGVRINSPRLLGFLRERGFEVDSDRP